MQTDIVISGFGGQGVLFAGQLLAYCALDRDKHVTWFPSYGPEMRGGTAHCTVIISDDEIGSPVVKTPTAAIVMNLPSLVKYESLIKPEGVLVVNKSLVDQTITRKDIHVIEVEANRIAGEIGNPRMTNMVLIGSLLKRLPVFTMEVVKATLDKHIPERHRDLLEDNIQALTRGFQEAEASRIKA